MRRITQLMATTLVTGCASTTPMVLGPDHPADPNAAAAPAPGPSTVLSVRAPPATATAADQAEAAPSHGSHGAGHERRDAHPPPQPVKEARP